MSEISVMERLSDYMLLKEAENRMSHFDSKEVMSQKQVMDSLGITEADLDDVDVEIE